MQSIPASAGADAIFEVFQKDGAVIIKDLFSADQRDRFCDEIQPALEGLNAGVGTEGLEESDIMQELIGEKTKRLGQLVTASTVFRAELLEKDLMHDLLERVFVQGPMDGYWMNASEVIEIGPGSEAQLLHRDQELYPTWNQAGPKMPEAICVFLTALTPFTATNGATQVAPGTHLNASYDHAFDPGFQGRMHLKTVPAIMDPGDCVFFSGKIIHGGGCNQTTNEHRRGLAMSFIRNILVPEQAHSLSIPREVADTMSYRGQAMLGFRSQWPIQDRKHAFYWSYQNSEIGGTIGLDDKTVSV